MKEINLTYVITTYNKLPYLRNVVSTLLKHIKDDEEIVITDGGSNDGTAEYLKDLFERGMIHQYVSEKDFGEAHGWNKGWLMAKGKLIKAITDDDAYFYPGIQKCKEFMLSHPEIDALSTDGLFTKSMHESSFLSSKEYSGGYYSIVSDYREDYNKWRYHSQTFTFSDLGWMLRRSSIPIFGLCDTSFTRVDAEFSFRLASKKSNLAWYTGKVWARILNPHSNSYMMDEKIKYDTERLKIMYPGSNLDKETWTKRWHNYLPQNIQNALRRIKNKITSKPRTAQNYSPTQEDWDNVFKLREEKLEEIYATDMGEFLYRDGK